MIEITGEQAIGALRKIVNDSNEDKTAACVYVIDNEPECIVARVLVELGAPINLLYHLEGRAFYEDTQRIKDACYTYGVTFSEDSYGILSVAQHVQDGFDTWGLALAKAEAVYADAS